MVALAIQGFMVEHTILRSLSPLVGADGVRLTSGISRGAHSVAGRRRLHAILGVAVRQGLYAQFPIFAGLTPMLPDADRTVLKSPEPIPPRRTVME